MNLPATRSLLCAAVLLTITPGVTGLKVLAQPSPLPLTDRPVLAADFAQPAKEYRAVALWHINGEPTPENVLRQLRDLQTSGFGSFMARSRDDGLFELLLDGARDLDLLGMWRDDTGYPSGGAGGQMEKLYPQHLRKTLEKTEYEAGSLPYWKAFVPAGDLMAAVAMDMKTRERIDLAPFIQDSLLSWEVPPGGDWRVMFFNCVPATYWKRDMPVDYLDAEALQRFRELTYDQLTANSARYFNDPIAWVQHDDVGFLARERCWTPLFNEKFKALKGFDPTLYYPALWYDIGPETKAARVAFFDTRSELLAEGYPRMVKEWSDAHGIPNVGQPPGSYKDQPVDILGDSFKFFRHVDIPQTDAIISYGNGLHGFKLSSSAAEWFERPISMMEAYGAFHEDTLDPDMFYRVAGELFVRGANFIMVHYGAWNTPDKVNMPYSIMGYSEDIVAELPAYNDYVGRACYLLTGGRRVADIALLYPIDSLQAEFYFDAPEYEGRLRRGWWTYPEADYLEISGLLTNEVRRDFTFVHPENLATDAYIVSPGNLRHETEHFQDYKVIVIPGGDVIPVETLKKIGRFYDAGGKVIATTLLPTRSSTFGRDGEVVAEIERIFGRDAARRPTLQTNPKGGQALFIPAPDAGNLSLALDRMAPHPNVAFTGPPRIHSELGYFSYIHKVRDGKDIYFFSNSSDDPVATGVSLRGRLKLQGWDPHSGAIADLPVTYEERDGVVYTKAPLGLSAVRSVFWIGERAPAGQ